MWLEGEDGAGWAGSIGQDTGHVANIGSDIDGRFARIRKTHQGFGYEQVEQTEVQDVPTDDFSRLNPEWLTAQLHGHTLW
jgi:hypothetical protein